MIHDSAFKGIGWTSIAIDAVGMRSMAVSKSLSTAIGLIRKAEGFEPNQVAFDRQIKRIEQLTPGYLKAEQHNPPQNRYLNQGKRFAEVVVTSIVKRFEELKHHRFTKIKAIDQARGNVRRGCWSLVLAINANS